MTLTRKEHMTSTETHPYNDDTDRWEKVAELHAGGYEWGIAVVWRDTTTGRLLGDTDGGCSCYGPFEEGDHSVENLVEITSRDQASTLIENVCGEDEVSTTERQDFVRAVEVALSTQKAGASA